LDRYKVPAEADALFPLLKNPIWIKIIITKNGNRNLFPEPKIFLCFEEMVNSQIVSNRKN